MAGITKTKRTTRSASKKGNNVVNKKNAIKDQEEDAGFSSESDDDFKGFSSTDDDSGFESESESENESNSKNKSEQKKVEEKVDVNAFASSDEEEDEEITDTLLNTSSTTKKSDSNNEKDIKEKRGVIYVGRIPHGFYEEQMKSYFSQYGDITRLRISRNKKTGKSKHFGFIEFKTETVAKIAAEAMNNYLLFGHILKVQQIAPENVHEELFAGANKTFKAVQWNRIAKYKNDKPKLESRWKLLKDKDIKTKKTRQQKLKAAGINFDISLLAPK